MIPALGQPTPIVIELLLASPRHRYDGRPADGAVPLVDLGLPAGQRESHEEVVIRAGLGIVGDRYFGKPAHRQASVTLMSAAAFDDVARDLGVAPLDPVAARRNVVLRGVDVDALRGARFALDSGEGPVPFLGHRPANPCAWMDRELAPGAFAAMRRRGGLRAEPTGDGVLRLGLATFVLLSAPTLHHPTKYPKP